MTLGASYLRAAAIGSMFADRRGGRGRLRSACIIARSSRFARLALV